MTLLSAIDEAAIAHPGKSGVAMLVDGRDALVARELLADAAERTLDVQYYIWHNDASGTAMFAALRRAADRGVQVRLLLDDNNSSAQLDSVLAGLDSHPNINVRLFNAFAHRRWRIVDYLTDFKRLNRRMHNKSYSVDGKLTIVGGRNIGDEYFDAGRGTFFVDLDVIAAGPVAREVADNFERYWTCESSQPLHHVLGTIRRKSSMAFRNRVATVDVSAPDTVRDASGPADSDFVRDLRAGTLTLEWAPVQMLSDDPAKVLGRARTHTLLWRRLQEQLGKPVTELTLISPYFVPGRRSMKFFAKLARQKIGVFVLTNALESTDVIAVHSGYAKRRKRLLRASVKLFELRGAATLPRGSRRGLRGSSRSSLHAKTIAMDRTRAFIGSFNFDPRSARLNTEMGFIIESAAIAGTISEAFVSLIPERAYSVQLGALGRVRWLERGTEGEVIHNNEPGAGVLRRTAVTILSWLPIDWLL